MIMAQAIIGNSNLPSSRQVPDHAIMDRYNKQVYLGNQFIANTGSLSITTSETPILYLANPVNALAGALSLFNSIKKLYVGDLTNSILFKVYTNPTTVAAGTTITPGNCRLASSVISTSVCKKSVTAVANGTLLEVIPMSLGSSPVDESTMLILDPGNSILITATGSAATTCAAELIWYEL